MKVTLSEQKARPACFIIEAAKGQGREANALVKRVMRKCKVNGILMGKKEAKSYGMNDARYLVDLADWQFRLVMETGSQMAKAEGWDRFPVDAYHD